MFGKGRFADIRLIWLVSLIGFGGLGLLSDLRAGRPVTPLRLLLHVLAGVLFGAGIALMVHLERVTKARRAGDPAASRLGWPPGDRLLERMENFGNKQPPPGAADDWRGPVLRTLFALAVTGWGLFRHLPPKDYAWFVGFAAFVALLAVYDWVCYFRERARKRR